MAVAAGTGQLTTYRSGMTEELRTPIELVTTVTEHGQVITTLAGVRVGNTGLCPPHLDPQDRTRWLDKFVPAQHQRALQALATVVGNTITGR